MVFRGVTVDLLWGNTTIKQETERDSSEDDIAVLPHMRAGTGTSSIASGYPAIAIQEELAGAVEGKKIKIEVTVPDLDRMELGLVMTAGKGEDTAALFDYKYEKQNGSGELVPVNNPLLADVSGVGGVSSVDGFYKIEIEREYSSDRLGGFATLEVVFSERGGVGYEKRDEFSMRFD